MHSKIDKLYLGAFIFIPVLSFFFVRDGLGHAEWALAIAFMSYFVLVLGRALLLPLVKIYGSGRGRYDLGGRGQPQYTSSPPSALGSPSCKIPHPRKNSGILGQIPIVRTPGIWFNKGQFLGVFAT